MNLAMLLLALVAEALALLGGVLLLRMIVERYGAARRGRKRSNYPFAEHTVTRLGTG